METDPDSDDRIEGENELMGPESVSADPLRFLVCRHCGRAYSRRLLLCPKCRISLRPLVPLPPPPPKRPKQRIPWRYDLGSIMLLIGVIAVGLGLTLQLSTAGIGIPILLFAPAMVVRMAPIFVHRRAQGGRGEPGDCVILFFESLFVVGVLVVSGLITFVVVCTATGLAAPGFYTNPFFWLATGAGSVAAIVVLFLIGSRIYPPKD